MSVNLHQSQQKDYNKSSMNAEDIINCTSGMDYSDALTDGKACDFDYANIFAKTPCTKENNYGYTSTKPCVLVKLNKLIKFEPNTNHSRPLGIECDLDVCASLLFCFFV